MCSAGRCGRSTCRRRQQQRSARAVRCACVCVLVESTHVCRWLVWLSVGLPPAAMPRAGRCRRSRGARRGSPRGAVATRRPRSPGPRHANAGARCHVCKTWRRAHNRTTRGSRLSFLWGLVSGLQRCIACNGGDATAAMRRRRCEMAAHESRCEALLVDDPKQLSAVLLVEHL